VKFVKYVDPDIVTRVLPQDHPKPADPPPPPIDFDMPSAPKAPTPVIDVAKGAPSPITVATTGPDKPLVFNTRVAAITDTHSKPPYPPLSRRLGHEGVVLLKLTVSPLGIITAVEIENSSGYADLDRTAAQWVKLHWRYRPATIAGHPVTSTAEASVRFNLKDSD
jgi:protein TonB